MEKPKKKVHVSKEARFQRRDVEALESYCLAHMNLDNSLLVEFVNTFKKRGYLKEDEYKSLREIMERIGIDAWAEKRRRSGKHGAKI